MEVYGKTITGLGPLAMLQPSTLAINVLLRYFLYKAIADFIGLPYFSGYPSGLKSHVLISHDFLSQTKFVPLPRDRAAMCFGASIKTPKEIGFCKQTDLYILHTK